MSLHFLLPRQGFSRSIHSAEIDMGRFIAMYRQTIEFSHYRRTDLRTVIRYEDWSPHAPPPASLCLCQNLERFLDNLSSVQNWEWMNQAANQHGGKKRVCQQLADITHRCSFFTLRNCKWGGPRVNGGDSHSWLLTGLIYVHAGFAKALYWKWSSNSNRWPLHFNTLSAWYLLMHLGFCNDIDIAVMPLWTLKEGSIILRSNADKAFHIHFNFNILLKKQT